MSRLALARWPRGGSVAAVMALSSMPLSSAHAHGAVAGMNSFYGGLFHPFQNVPQVLVLVGAGLWLGQSRGARIGWPSLAFAAAMLLALVLTTGIAGPLPATPPWLLIGLAMGFGVMVALALHLPFIARVVLAVVAALAVGFDSGVDGSPPLGTLGLMLLGTWISTSVLVANVAYYASALPERRWLQIAVRIVGSWMAAAGVLVMAFYWRG